MTADGRVAPWRRLLRDGHLLRAFVWMWLRRPSQALWALDQALAIEPGSAGWLVMRAMLLGVLGREKEAEAAYTEAVAFEPGNARVHVCYAEALIGWGRFAEAGRELGIARQVEPSSPHLQRVLAVYTRRVAEAGRR